MNQSSKGAAHAHISQQLNNLTWFRVGNHDNTQATKDIQTA